VSRDIPIIFSAPMVRALLEGRKTMTRRIFKMNGEPPPRWDGRFGFSVLTPDRYVELRGVDPERGPLSRFMPLRYTKADRLWVRERWKAIHSGDPTQGARYRADVSFDQTVWRPSIHMPRWASRLTLIVTGVKVERLHDIVLHDVRAEGCEVRQFWLFGLEGEERRQVGVRVFGHLWEEIHGRESWDANPFVVAVSFRVIKANIDAPEARIAA
jgi:hypothetical protein